MSGLTSRRGFLAGIVALVASPAAYAGLLYRRSGIHELPVPASVKAYEAKGWRQIIVDGSDPRMVIKWSHDSDCAWKGSRFA
jgi:hypothetical protein